MPASYAWHNIDIEKPRTLQFEIEEYITELYDSRLNFMGLSTPKKIDYVNIDVDAKLWPDNMNNGQETYLFTLSKKVTF